MREAPTVEQFAQQNSNKAKVVSIGFRANLNQSRAWASDYGLNTPIALVDSNNGVAFAYDVYQFPRWILLDSSGQLVAQGSRFDNSIQQQLDSLG